MRRSEGKEALPRRAAKKKFIVDSVKMKPPGGGGGTRKREKKLPFSRDVRCKGERKYFNKGRRRGGEGSHYLREKPTHGGEGERALRKGFADRDYTDRRVSPNSNVRDREVLTWKKRNEESNPGNDSSRKERV